MNENYYEKCVICLKSSEKMKTFNECSQFNAKVTLAEAYRGLTNLEPPFGQICLTCAELTTKFIEFQALALKSHEILTAEPVKTDENRESDWRSFTPELPSYTCDLCQQHFTSHRLIEIHIRKVHRSKKPWKCWQPECGRVFRNESEVKNHQKISHEKLRVACCDFCGKTFRDKTILGKHVLIHMNLKPIKCGVEGCSATFRQTSELQSHTKYVHCHDRPFVCECGKTFKLKEDLRRHRSRMHTKDNFKECPICQKLVLARTSAFQQHIAVAHEGARPKKCPICTNSYGYTQNLHTHIKAIHPEFYQKMLDDGRIKRRAKRIKAK